ncbi:MAG TPA: hypothetical protein VJ840_08555 [Gemmatimonadaceae bacterium]|nr:hypothetical protein [Gemmatimonadaceae bacterium]
MPISYTISREDRLIKATAFGIIRAPDLHGLLDSVLAEAELGPGLRGLYDARHAEPDLTVLELADVANKARHLINRGLGRIAIVAESQNTYRVSTIFCVLARALGIDVDVFRDLSAAESWLNESDPDSPSGEHTLTR